MRFAAWLDLVCIHTSELSDIHAAYKTSINVIKEFRCQFEAKIEESQQSPGVEPSTSLA